MFVTSCVAVLTFSAGLRLPQSSAVAVRTHPCAMAGFGGGAAPSSKKKKGAKKDKTAELSPKKQWDRLKEFARAGEPRNAVYARARGEEDWFKVGEVATKAGVDLATAVQTHKRMILEHAVRVSPKHSTRAKELECGFGTGDAGEPVPLDSRNLTPAAAAACGFEGAPDATARYFRAVDSGRDTVDKAFGKEGKGGKL